MKLFFAIAIPFFLLVSCTKAKTKTPQKTEYVIVVVVDGARASETWLAPNQPYIPRQKELLSQGTVINNFRNAGPTWTMSGHGALVTGKFDWVDNSGATSPKQPNIFQLYRKKHGIPANQTWIVASKGKVAALANCIQKGWYNEYMPNTNCGIGGQGATSGYREDPITFDTVMHVLKTYHPKLMLVNFREPDYSAHQANYEGYLNGIESTDQFVGEMWEWIQNDPIYKGKTALFVTNDHGRHLDSIADGFVSHGDYCEGCKRLTLFALGPEFKKNKIITTPYEQIDLPVTIGHILDFEIPVSNGKVMHELYK